MKRKNDRAGSAALIGALLWMAGGRPATAGTNVWTPIGPGGSINDLAIDPQNPSTLYAAGDGVHKSIDGGGRWFEIGQGRQPANTGLTGRLTFIVPKHRSGHDLSIEQIDRDDHVERSTVTRQK